MTLIKDSNAALSLRILQKSLFLNCEKYAGIFFWPGFSRIRTEFTIPEHIAAMIFCIVTTKTTNQTKPPENIGNHLKPSATNRNHPQPPTQNYPPLPSSPSTSSKLHEPVRNFSYPCKNTQILLGVWVIGWWESDKEWFWPFEHLWKLKTTFCIYWTSIKTKISMTFVCKEYEDKIIMV